MGSYYPLEADLDVCAPRKIELPLENEKIVKIKTTLDRNAVITGII